MHIYILSVRQNYEELGDINLAAELTNYKNPSVSIYTFQEIHFTEAKNNNKNNVFS